MQVSVVQQDLVRRQKSCDYLREGHDPFPLTPALSLGEREDRRQSVEESETAGMFEGRTALHPLRRERAGVRGSRAFSGVRQQAESFGPIFPLLQQRERSSSFSIL